MSETSNSAVQKKKKPVFLIVLLVLTGISLVSTFFSGVIPLVSGPMTTEELLQEEVKMAKTLGEAKKLLKSEEMSKQIEEASKLAFTKLRFVHTNVFWRYHLLFLLVFTTGAAAVYFMFNLKKLGYHLYIIYCILAIGMNYLCFPSDMIVSSEIYGALFISGLFILLYGLNLKHFNENDQPENQFTYTN